MFFQFLKTLIQICQSKFKILKHRLYFIAFYDHADGAADHPLAVVFRVLAAMLSVIISVCHYYPCQAV
jgi:hypothetical protein